jgi:isoleucyl-tRNA synthetase
MEHMAALVTDLTPALVQEGLAREFVRRVQDLRKQADFDISDRIDLFVDCTKSLKEAIAEYGDYIAVETLAKSIRFELPVEGGVPVADEFDGEKMRIVILQTKS